MTITAFLSRSPRLFNRGPGGPASLWHSPHSNIFSPTDSGSELQLINRGSWGSPLLGAGSLYCILSPPNSNFLCTELYYCFTPTQFNLSTVKVSPWHLRPDAPVIYTGAFPIVTARPRSICNIYIYIYIYIYIAGRIIFKWPRSHLFTQAFFA